MSDDKLLWSALIFDVTSVILKIIMFKCTTHTQSFQFKWQISLAGRCLKLCVPISLFIFWVATSKIQKNESNLVCENLVKGQWVPTDQLDYEGKNPANLRRNTFWPWADSRRLLLIKEPCRKGITIVAVFSMFWLQRKTKFLKISLLCSQWLYR